MPDSFSGEGFGHNYDDFFMRFRSWVNFQEARLPNDADKIEAFKYVLSDIAILWWNAVVAAGNVPITLNEVRDLFYALAPLIYVSSVIDIPEKANKKVDTIIQNLIWEGKTAKIKKYTLIQTIEKGGFKLCDFETKVKSKLSWVKRLVENNNAKWKVLPQHFYKLNNLSVYFNAHQNKLTNSKIPPFYKDIHNLFMINCKTTPIKAK